MNKEDWIDVLKQYDPFCDVTPQEEKVFSLMAHCVGLGEKKPKNYYPYRNHFDAGGEDIPIWEALTEWKYAEYNGMYHLTVAGMIALSVFYDIQVWSENAKYSTDTRIATFKYLCEADNYCCYGCWFPTSAHHIANTLNIPYKRVLAACHKLEADGIIIKGYDGGMDDEGYVHCYHGYYLTEKARETEEWKRAREESNKEIQKSLDNMRGDP